MCDYKAASLNARQDILTVEIPKLAEEAAAKAILEWGQPISTITHLVFVSTAGVDSPGADFQLMKLLGLSPSVKRCMMYHQGCFGGGTALRIAKDLAENNRSARVLVVCCEITVSTFHGPSDVHHDNLIGQALFGDGAGAAIVGADPAAGIEKPLFEMVFADQTIIPDSATAVTLHTREQGLTFHLQKSVCSLISTHIERILKEMFGPLTISDWNEFFWIVHPGGPAILDEVEDKLNLDPGKMDVSRQVLNEYGNMAGATVLFIMDRMRRRSAKRQLQTSGEGMDSGVLLGFGPGLTIEAIVLHSIQTSQHRD